jgi:putative ABC transport system permease protein
VAVLGHELWQRRFGGDREVVGRSVVLDGEPHTVVGVMPPGPDSHFLGWRQLWTPLVVDEAAALASPLWGFSVLGRVRPEASVAAARLEMEELAARLAVESPATNDGWGVVVEPVRWWLVGDLETPLLLIFAAGVLVLLVACATVAIVIYATAATRRREVAVRKALGAGRGSLLRRLLAESMLMAVAGGGVGLVLAYSGVALLPSLLPMELPRFEAVAIDERVLLFTVGMALLAGVVSGLAPAVALLRTAPAALREGGERSTGSRRRRWGRELLVALQTALAVVAVLGSGLLVRSLAAVRSVDPGFDAENLLTLRVELPEEAAGGEPKARIATFRGLLERLESLPGVERAAATGTRLPLTGSHGTFELYLEGHPKGPRPDVTVIAQTVSPSYLEAMGMTLTAGRWFEPGEVWDETHAVVVNETLARRYWPDREPVGRWVEWGSGDRGRVVGVVADVRQLRLHLDPEPEAYLPWGTAPRGQALVVRTATPPAGLVAPVRDEIRRFLPGTPVSAVATGRELLADSYDDRSFQAAMMALFALLAQGLGLLGVYGVVAHAVASRRREIGVRVALGARPGRIVRWVVGQGLRPVLAGLVAGVVVALFATRLLAGQLFAVTPEDPATFVAGAALVLLLAALVCLLPARRAVRLDPAEAVRAE